MSAINIPVLEIGTSKINCMLALQDGKKNVPPFSSVSYEGIKNGSFVDRGRTALAIVAAVEQAEYESARRIDEVIVGVPACFLLRETAESSVPIQGEYIKNIDISNIKNSFEPVHYADAKLVDNRIVYYMDDDDEVYVDKPLGIRTENLSAQAVFTYVSREITDLVELALKKMRINVLLYVASDFAQAMHYIPPAERDKSAVLIDIGSSMTSVSAVYAEAVTKHATTYIGSDDVTGDLAIALDTDMKMALSIRRNFVFGIDDDGNDRTVYGKDSSGKLTGFPAATVSKAIYKRLDSITEQIIKGMEEISDVLMPDSKLYFTGMDSDIRGLDQYLTVKLGKRVQSLWTSQSILTAEYNTCLALLDNDAYSLYDLKESKSKKISLVSRFFKNKRK